MTRHEIGLCLGPLLAVVVGFGILAYAVASAPAPPAAESVTEESR